MSTPESQVELPAPDASVEQPEDGLPNEAESSTAAEESGDSSPRPKKDGVSERINELTRLRREAERNAQYWREQAMRQTPAKPETVTTEAPKAAPKLEDFNYDEAAYQAALTAHVTTEAARQVREEFRKEQEQLTQKQKVESWRKRAADFSAKTPDYEDTAYGAPIPDEAADIIMDCENGPEIAYYLGKHPDEAKALEGMSEAGMARAIGRLEVRLSVPPAPAPAPKPVSKAPPPTPKIEATEGAPRVSTTSPDSDSMSDAEWVKAEQARLARKVKRNA